MLLKPRELDCLLAISQGQQGAFGPCPSDVLDSLSDRGLLEIRSDLRLPLECIHPVYRLTPEGEKVLAQHHHP